MSKTPVQTFPAKRAILVVILVLIVAACGVLLSMCGSDLASVVRDDQARIQSWLDTQPSEAAEVWLSPLLSGTEGPSTVSGSQVITNRSRVVAVAAALHSRRSRTSFLGPFGHWGTTRYAKLKVRLDNESMFVFFVAWHDTGNVCAFGLPRHPGAHSYLAGDIIELGASEKLANELNQLVVASRLSWVPAYESRWNISSNTLSYMSEP